MTGILVVIKFLNETNQDYLILKKVFFFNFIKKLICALS